MTGDLPQTCFSCSNPRVKQAVWSSHGWTEYIPGVPGGSHHKGAGQGNSLCSIWRLFEYFLQAQQGINIIPPDELYQDIEGKKTREASWEWAVPRSVQLKLVTHELWLPIAKLSLNSTKLKLRLSVSLISTLIQPPSQPATHHPPGTEDNSWLL